MNVIVDYQAGNLANLKNALEYLGLENQIATGAETIANASHILMPGVGAFQPAMENLRKSGMMEAILEQIDAGVPFLGICLGLQLLFSEGWEGGKHEGLGIIEGVVVRFDHELKIPQMGWNQVVYCREDPLFRNIPDNSHFYFVHSYHGVPENAEVTLAQTDYGIPFTSVLHSENVWGVQFHPEKSQSVGLRLLNNFCHL